MTCFCAESPERERSYSTCAYCVINIFKENKEKKRKKQYSCSPKLSLNKVLYRVAKSCSQILALYAMKTKQKSKCLNQCYLSIFVDLLEFNHLVNNLGFVENEERKKERMKKERKKVMPACLSAVSSDDAQRDPMR